MKTIENMGLEAIDLHGPVKLSREVEGFREVGGSSTADPCRAEPRVWASFWV